ncbi:hypothetical protein JTE90_004349 [Oedothorax gibbosus]|uniref:Uncharacterized protein n=1 Tax=Oedothorax gibbosus TaxID=931172 RepID=A0AAV6VLJ4_9ARAC|nr:hypothetical protein JTE90_004349 [Oedothorax gibbosus]
MSFYHPSYKTASITDFRTHNSSDHTANDTSGMAHVPWFSLLTMVTISATLSFMADAQDCFGGIETFEKMVSMSFSGVVQYKTMLQQPGQAITRDCINLCKQQAACLSFSLNYTSSSCISYNVNSVGRGDDIVLNKAINFYEKICFRGVSKQAFDSACRDRLWVFDRVRDAYLEGHVDKEARNVRTKEDCEKLCITEERFKCRSADYDEVQHTCRMSRETRRTKPNAFRLDPGSGRNYLENQCAPPPPASCRYETKSDVTLLTPDYLQFAASATDCMDQCDAETAFNCWSYSYVDNRCQLSGDSSVTWGRDVQLPSHPGAVYGELKCFFEQCDNGVMTFEKMTGVLLRSAQSTMMKVNKPGALGNTLECARICLEDGTECPAFSDHYHNMRCDRLDRNSNGRTQELIARDGESYFEKICLQGPEAQACSDKAWAFERALGYELSESLYEKTINKVETRTSCIQLCLSEREFTCRSARYNEESGECKLSSADRRTEPMKYYRSEDARVSYLENSCLPVDTACPYVETEDAYPTYANIIQTEGVSTLESCRDLCNELTKFSCRSFSYYSSALQCFLSGDDKASGGSAAIQRRPGIVYYERMCPQASTVEPAPTDAPTAPEVTVTSSVSVPTPGISSNTQPQFQQDKETTQKTRPPYQPQEPSRPECSPTERLIFEKLTGFEPFGVTSTLLYRGDSSTPGITAECVRRCQTLSDCRSFVLDHQRFECSSVQDPPSIHPADFRASIGKTFFGGLCVPAYVGCSKLWVYERIMDHELQGLSPIDVVRVVSLEQCQQFCLETRKYVCRSANYFHLRRECQVFGDDRTADKAQLVEASRVDFFENQCLVETSFCPYQKSEEDVAMIYVTKSIPDTLSTLHCERECNREREFNCRSYSYWDRGAHGSVCMLSAESRLTGQGVGLSYRAGATYSGKTCKISLPDSRQQPTIYPPVKSNKEEESTHPPPRITDPTTLHPPPHHEFPPHNPPPYKPDPHKPPPKKIPPPPLHPLPPHICTPNQFTYEKVMGHDVRGGRRERVPTRVPVGVVHACQTECQRLGDRCQGFVVQYKSYQNCYVILRNPTDEPILVPSFDAIYFNKVCLRERPCPKLWSFERYLHHELHSEPLRVIPGVPERADCEDFCLREAPHCKSAVYHYLDRQCYLYTETKRSTPSKFLYTNEEVEYLENQCSSDAPTCQYRDFPDRFLPQLDRLTRAYNLKDCQRQCDTERDFVCRSINFETVAKDCALSSEDVSSVPQGISSLQPRRNSLYSEKGSCEQVSVQCNPHDMLLTIHFDSPFHGRVYAKGNPSQCFVVGTGQSSLQFAISMGSRCGTTAESADQFVNEVVVQQHPVIMTDHDKTIKVVCSFETQERTYTMAGPGVGDSGVDVARTYNKAALTAVVTNTAPPPNVAMRVLDRTGRDARAVGLGEELTLKIELREATSAFAIFARNLYARSTNGESLFLIDSSGCPTDAAIFPALELDPNDHKSLVSTFKAFRFPTSGMVNFEVQIRFCQEKCEQVRCGGKGHSYGRKKREAKQMSPMFFDNRTNYSLLDDDDVYFDGDNYDSVRAVVQEESQSIVVPSANEMKHESDEVKASTTSNPITTVRGYFTDRGQSSESPSMEDGTTHVDRIETDSQKETLEVTGTETYENRDFSESVTELYQIRSDKSTISRDILEATEHQKETNGYSNAVVPDTSVGDIENNSTGEKLGTMPNNETTDVYNSFSTTDSISEEISNSLTTKSIVSESTASPHELTTGSKILNSESTQRSSIFNRKFAFIHNDDNNTSQYTTPLVYNIHPRIHNYAFNNNDTERKLLPDNDNRSSFPRPDLKSYNNNPSLNIQSQNGERHIYGNERWPTSSRRDPFSSNRNPYSSLGNRGMEANKTQEQNQRPPIPIHTYNNERVQPLPLNPQRLVDPISPQRPWNAPMPQSTDTLTGHASGYPPLKSHPIEIHEMPNSWDGTRNPQSPLVPYNIYNPQDTENRQAKVVTTSPNFQDTRPREINSNTNLWGSHGPQPGVQIQRPLEILDHPSQRNDRHPSYPQGRQPSNQPRPIEISNPQERNPYPSNRYDFNRPMPMPRPGEHPNPAQNPQAWNNQNQGNGVPTAATLNYDRNNMWGNNLPTNTRLPPRGVNRPPDEITIHSQPYPQQPSQGQNNPPRNDDVWRQNAARPGGSSNSVPGRNNFYASQPQYRPSEVIATTQKSVPEEVPLSLAILVGEDGKSQNAANQKPKQQWRPPPTQYNRGLQRHNIINTPRPEPIDEDKVCTSKATVIATAVSVTLVYLGVVAGAVVGYRWHRKNRRRKAMTTPAHPVHYPPNPTTANVTYSTPDVTFRNVYGNFPVSSTSTT